MAGPSPEDIQRILGIHPDQLLNPQSQTDDGQPPANSPADTTPPLLKRPEEPRGLDAPNVNESQSDGTPPLLKRPEETHPEASPGSPKPALGDSVSSLMRTPIKASNSEALNGFYRDQASYVSRQERFRRDAADLDRMTAEGSGISRFQHKHSLLGKIIKPLEIAGSVIAPGAMALVPGTTLNYQQKLARQRGIIDDDLRAEREAAQNTSTNAEARYHNAQAEELENTTEVTGSDGQKYRIPNKDLEKFLANKNTVAGRENVAHISADNKIALQDLKNDIQAGKIKWVKPAVDGDGRAVLGAYDQNGNLVKYLDRSIGPAWLQPTVRSSVDVKEDGNGGFIYIPKTSTTRRIVDGGSAGAGAQKQNIQPAGAPGPGALGMPPVTTPITTGRGGAGTGRVARQVPASAVQPVIASGGGQAGGKASKDAGYAYDPHSGATVLTTRMEAGQRGLQDFRKVSQKDIDNDRNISNRLSDVETKLNRYDAALSDHGLTEDDRSAIGKIIRSDKLKLGIFGVEVPVDQVNLWMRENRLGQLSDAGVKALAAYYNARESMSGYQRVLSGSSRGSDKTMELNIDALPKPTDTARFAKEAIQQFRENIPIMRRGLPVLPGVNDGPYGGPRTIQQSPHPQQYPGINFVPSGK